MINKQEIMEFAREFGLAPNIIEKDYALGWLLAGIGNYAELSKKWMFKGGTCLKKCFFETYRFSEDLDFTVTESGHLDEQFLLDAFADIADWVYETSGIEMPRDTIFFDVYANKRGKISVQGRVGYKGPLQRRGDPPRIKLDLTNDEVLVLEPVKRKVHHPYSDRPDSGIHVLCYSFEEVFAEKVRALAERMRPRDLYDVVHLHWRNDLKSDINLVMSTLNEKCAFKGIPVPTIEILAKKPERVELEAEWENMLAHQLQSLPSFEKFWQELPGFFDWISGVVTKVIPPSMPVGKIEIDTLWQAPAMASSRGGTALLEVIRYAAANHMCIDLGYKGSHSLIEPYSLRKTQDGNLLLYAVKHETGEERSYRVDRIESVAATQVLFVPKYLIELTSTGSPPRK